MGNGLHSRCRPGANGINAAYERMLQGDVKYRFVIDNATLAS